MYEKHISEIQKDEKKIQSVTLLVIKKQQAKK